MNRAWRTVRASSIASHDRLVEVELEISTDGRATMMPIGLVADALPTDSSATISRSDRRRRQPMRRIAFVGLVIAGLCGLAVVYAPPVSADTAGCTVARTSAASPVATCAYVATSNDEIVASVIGAWSVNITRGDATIVYTDHANGCFGDDNLAVHPIVFCGGRPIVPGDQVDMQLRGVGVLRAGPAVCALDPICR